MPIPELDGEGLLPEGLHPCTVDEVAEMFGRFTTSDRRIQLVTRLRSYCVELQSVEMVKFLVLDGSFVTSKDEPNDIDILLALRSDLDPARELAPFERNALSSNWVRKKYGFDLMPAPDGSDEYGRYLDFFSQVKGRSGHRKGLLKVTV